MAKCYEERIRDLERFEIRDIETKKVKQHFRSKYAAQSNLDHMNFGLNKFYEIYDTHSKKVVNGYRGGSDKRK